MKLNGLNVDARAIGAGLYQIICDKGEESIVAFGMIPKWIMDLAEKLIREKIFTQLELTYENQTIHAIPGTNDLRRSWPSRRA